MPTVDELWNAVTTAATKKDAAALQIAVDRFVETPGWVSRLAANCDRKVSQGEKQTRKLLLAAVASTLVDRPDVLATGSCAGLGRLLGRAVEITSGSDPVTAWTFLWIGVRAGDPTIQTDTDKRLRSAIGNRTTSAEVKTLLATKPPGFSDLPPARRADLLEVIQRFNPPLQVQQVVHEVVEWLRAARPAAKPDGPHAPPRTPAVPLAPAPPAEPEPQPPPPALAEPAVLPSPAEPNGAPPTASDSPAEVVALAEPPVAAAEASPPPSEPSPPTDPAAPPPPTALEQPAETPKKTATPRKGTAAARPKESDAYSHRLGELEQAAAARAAELNELSDQVRLLQARVVDRDEFEKLRHLIDGLTARVRTLEAGRGKEPPGDELKEDPRMNHVLAERDALVQQLQEAETRHRRQVTEYEQLQEAETRHRRQVTEYEQLLETESQKLATAVQSYRTGLRRLVEPYLLGVPVEPPEEAAQTEEGVVLIRLLQSIRKVLRAEGILPP